MAEETGDDDFSDVGLGGVGTTAGYAHYSDQKKQKDETQYKVSKRERKRIKQEIDRETETQIQRQN